MGTTIAITGVNGYAASTILPLLESDPDIEKIVGIDSTPWKGGFKKVSFIREKLQSSRIAEIIAGTDIVCHLAVDNDPTHDRQAAHENNIQAADNLFSACAKCRIKKIICLTSTSVYAFQDPPAPLYAEDYPVSAEKQEDASRSTAIKLEKIADQFVRHHPDIIVTMIRSAMLMGPNIENFLEKSLSMKLFVLPAGDIGSIQFIHESDFGSVLHLLIKNNTPGILNAAADDTVPLKWCFQKTGVRVIPLPEFLAAWIADIGFMLRIYPLNGDRVRLLNQSFRAGNEKLKKAVSWRPAYSSKTALMMYADKLVRRRSKDNVLQAALSWIIKSGKRLKPFLPILATFHLGKVPGVRRLVPWLNPEENSINYLPVNERIETRNNVLPAQVVHDLIESASGHVIMDKCGCRMLRNCSRYTQDVGCLFMGETALRLPHGVCRPVTKTEAHAHADRAIGLGLLPMTGKVRIDNFIYMTPDRSKLLSLCFCCDCCCILTSYKHVPGKYLDGIIQPIEGLIIEISDNCTGCGTCLETCAFNAISIIDGRAVHNSQCRGCGRCERFCPSNAVSISIRNAHYDEQVKKRIRSLVEF